LFASNFDTLYSNIYLALVHDEEEGTHNNTPFFEGLKDVMKIMQPFAPLDA
jgi:hypothetical protein